jgi:hypothetical protein
VIGAVALARRPVDLDDHVPELCAGAGEPPVQLAVEHHSAADASADRERDRVAGAARRPPPVLGQGGHVGVVVDERGQAEALGHDVAQREVDDR